MDPENRKRKFETKDEFSKKVQKRAQSMIKTARVKRPVVDDDYVNPVDLVADLEQDKTRIDFYKRKIEKLDERLRTRLPDDERTTLTNKRRDFVKDIRLLKARTNQFQKDFEREGVDHAFFQPDFPVRENLRKKVLSLFESIDEKKNVLNRLKKTFVETEDLDLLPHIEAVEAQLSETKKKHDMYKDELSRSNFWIPTRKPSD